MQIDAVEVQNAKVIRPHGRIDSGTSTELEQMLKGEGSARLLLDLSDVAYMSSAGLRVVLIATKAARAAGGSFAVFGMTESVSTLFEMSGFDRIVTVFDTEADALASIGA